MNSEVRSETSDKSSAEWAPGVDQTYCKNCGRTFDMHIAFTRECPVRQQTVHERGLQDYMDGGAGR